MLTSLYQSLIAVCTEADPAVGCVSAVTVPWKSYTTRRNDDVGADFDNIGAVV